MKALTLTQPWATAIAIGLKRVETRSWYTSYRGPLAIHAAKGFPSYARAFARMEQAAGRIPIELPLGEIVATTRLIGVSPTSAAVRLLSELEKSYGDYSDGRFAWILEDVQRVNPPVPAKGALGLWEWKE